MLWALLRSGVHFHHGVEFEELFRHPDAEPPPVEPPPSHRFLLPPVLAPARFNWLAAITPIVRLRMQAVQITEDLLTNGPDAAPDGDPDPLASRPTGAAISRVL